MEVEDLNIDRAIAKLCVRALNTSKTKQIAAKRLGISSRNLIDKRKLYSIEQNDYTKQYFIQTKN